MPLALNTFNEMGTYCVNVPKKYTRHPQLAGRVVDELAFVVTAANNKLHCLNSTATRIWELCAEPRQSSDVAEAIADEFDVPYNDALLDVQACMDDFVAREILVADGD